MDDVSHDGRDHYKGEENQIDAIEVVMGDRGTVRWTRGTMPKYPAPGHVETWEAEHGGRWWRAYVHEHRGQRRWSVNRWSDRVGEVSVGSFADAAEASDMILAMLPAEGGRA